MIEKIDEFGKRYMELDDEDLKKIVPGTKIYFVGDKKAIPPDDCKHEYYRMFGIRACKKCILWETPEERRLNGKGTK